MTGEPTRDRLSDIDTMWTLLRRAHAGPETAAADAKRVLLERYGGAVRRYLFGLLRDPHAADDLTQEFAVRLLAGGFHNADPARGRFRNYVKTALFHLVAAHQRGRQKAPHPVAPDDEVLAELADGADGEQTRAFTASWRAELLSRAWAILAREHPAQNAVLQYRVAHPEVPADEIARRLGQQLGRPLTGANVRQLLKRGRAVFTELLVEQVTHTLGNPTPDEVAAELADVGLLEFVRPAQT